MIIMADNYLERRMEDLRGGRIAASLRPRKGKAPVASVLVAGEFSAVEPLVREHRRRGDRTAFLAADRVAGTALAQQCGARFYPCDVPDGEALAAALADLRRHWRTEPEVIMVE